MSHFGRTGPPDIKDTYSVLVLNISFRTTADDLFPLFDKYGKVVDIFIPRDRRTGDSRGFAFVRYKYAEEAQKAVDRVDGRSVDGRDIMVQFAKYGPNAERIHKGRIVEELPKSSGRSRSRSPRPSHKGRIVEELPKSSGRSRSRSPRPRYREDYRDRDYRRRSPSPSRDKYRRRDYRRRSKSVSASPDAYGGRGRGRARSRSHSYDRSSSPRRTPPRGGIPARHTNGKRSLSRSVSPRGRRARSVSASSHSSG